MSDAFWAFGSTLKLGDGGSPEVFTAVAEITDISPPSMGRDLIEVTHHASPGGYREFISGLRDGGEVSLEANWLPTDATHDQVTGLLSYFDLNVTSNWQIVLPDTIATIEFTGFLTAFEGSLNIEEQGKLSCTIKVVGPVTVG